MKLPEQGDGAPRRLELELPAAHAYARMGRQVVRAFARLDGLSDTELETLGLVTSELLSNAVDHGGGEAARETSGVTMRMVLLLGRGTWRLSVSDQGGGSPAELEPYLESEIEVALTDERGRGFFLMRQLADAVRVERSADGRGLCITVTKGALAES